jgi:hypothetical protein
MNEPLSKEMRGPVLEYMKQYARASGWTIQTRFGKGYIDLIAASRAPSKSSKNFSESLWGSRSRPKP